MLLGTLAVSLLGSALAGKGVNLIEEIDSNESQIRYKQSRLRFLMLPHPLTNFGISKYQNEQKFNGFYSTNNLPEVKNGEKIS